MRRLIQILLCVLLITASCAAEVKMPPTVSQEEANKALLSAFSMVGVRYVWGGQSPAGFDCSGLAIWAYNRSVQGIQWRLGDALVNDTTAHGLFMYNVKPVDPDEVWPGDLVFVTTSTERVTHMGMFSRWLNERHTKFEWIEASSSKKGVVVSTWVLGRNNGDKMLVGVGRVLRWPSIRPDMLSAGS